MDTRRISVARFQRWGRPVQNIQAAELERHLRFLDVLFLLRGLGLFLDLLQPSDDSTRFSSVACGPTDSMPIT